MAKKMKMPHPGHEEHLCYFENIGYLRVARALGDRGGSKGRVQTAREKAEVLLQEMRQGCG